MYKVLLVEDNPQSSSDINKLLSEFCQVHSTSSAAIAMNLATANKYSLIMIDVNQRSGTSGINIANSIRNMSNYNSIPIVAFVLMKLIEKKEYLLSCGYTHIISEPFNKRNFAQQIKFIISSQQNNIDSLPSMMNKIASPKLVY